MPYLLLIVEPRGQRAACPPDEAHRRYDAMMAFTSDLQRDGVLLRAESLRPDDHAVRVSRSAPDALPSLVDGPFAEAKEMVGGFFLIDVASRQTAVAIAERCPAVDFAAVEVRECAPCHVL
ncbi:MAG: dehydrogenase [Betaproteobacteria bacterium HGW-Betaproteobacteria-7]|nr:MAG: dehydrogenase [Betaproteobacteria bacterium HGW-Betaproteobacteria-7]